MEVASKFREWEILVSRKIRSKKYFVSIFSKTVWNFGVPSALVYGDWGRNSCKKLGDFLKFFRQRAPNFYRDLLKDSLNLYC